MQVCVTMNKLEQFIHIFVYNMTCFSHSVTTRHIPFITMILFVSCVQYTSKKNVTIATTKLSFTPSPDLVYSVYKLSAVS